MLDKNKTNISKIKPNKTYKIIKIKDLEEKDKPREKLIKNGPSSLIISELLAIVLNTGTKKEDVLSMSFRLLHDYGEKAITKINNPNLLKQEFNIPITKACQIISCLEIGKRLYRKSNQEIITLRTAKDVFKYLKNMGELKKEQFRGLYLNSNYELIHDEIISLGTINATLIHPREVFRPAIEYSSSAIIIAHNHYSNTLKASLADIKTTKQLIEAGKIIGIEILDHLIIGKNTFISII